jgi:hypothetical protein
LYKYYPQLPQPYAHIKYQFSRMKTADNVIDKSHRGQVVQSVMANKKLNGHKITQVWLAQKLGISRKTIENWLDKHDLDAVKIREVGRAIGHDFSIQFPELKKDLVWTFGDEQQLYGNSWIENNQP